MCAGRAGRAYSLAGLAPHFKHAPQLWEHARRQGCVSDAPLPTSPAEDFVCSRGRMNGLICRPESAKMHGSSCPRRRRPYAVGSAQAQCRSDPLHGCHHHRLLGAGPVATLDLFLGGAAYFRHAGHHHAGHGHDPALAGLQPCAAASPRSGAGTGGAVRLYAAAGLCPVPCVRPAAGTGHGHDPGGHGPGRDCLQRADLHRPRRRGFFRGHDGRPPWSRCC